MADNKVSVEISLEEKAALKALTNLTREINKTESSFKDMGATGDDSLGIVSQATQGLSNGFGSLVKGVTIANLASEAIIGTANSIKNFALESVNAALEAEASNQRLAQSLKAANSFTQESFEDMKAYSGALAEATVHGDDEIASQIALAKSMGATNLQAKQLVQAATELTATFGGTLDQRVEQLGKTLTGTGGKLDTLIPGFKALTEEQLKSGEAFQFVNEKFGGAASAQLDTYGGKVIQLKKSFGELQEAIGLLVVESGVDSVFSGIAAAINDMTQAMSDNRIEALRQKEGFTETSASLEQLKRRYDETRVAAIDLEQRILKPSMSMDQTAIIIAKRQLAELNDEIARTKTQIEAVQPKVDQDFARVNTSSVPTGGISPEDQRIIDSRLAANIALQQAYVDQAAWEAEQELLKREITTANYAIELEQYQGIEEAKISAKYDSELQKAKLIEDSVTRQLTIEKLASDRSLAIQKASADAELKLKAKLKADEEKLAQERVAIAANLISAGSALAKQGTNEQKNLAYASALVNTYAAGLRAYRDYPYPANIAVMASTVAAGMAQVRQISAVRYESGGIVPGNSMTGDLINARLNSGEMVLNRQQQTELFKVANGSGGSTNELISEVKALRMAIESNPTIVSIDGRSIATAVRREIQNGYRLL